MKSTDKIMEMLCSELEDIAEKGQLSAGDLETLHKLIVTKEKLLRIEELEENLGYSQDGGWRAEGTYSRYGNKMNADNGNSYSKGRYYNRSHSYSGGRSRYSMSEGSDMMMKAMQDMINDPNMSEADRNTLRKAMEVVR